MTDSTTDAKALLRAFFAAGDAGELHLFADYLHQDVVVHAPADLSTAGIAQEVDSWRKARAVMPDLHHELFELVSEGATVAARCIVSGTLHGRLGSLAADGRHFSLDQAVFAHVRDGKIDELWEIVDTGPLRQPAAPDA